MRCLAIYAVFSSLLAFIWPVAAFPSYAGVGKKTSTLPSTRIRLALASGVLATPAEGDQNGDLGGWLFESCYGGVEEEAFLQCVTVEGALHDCKKEALRIYHKWGVVRIPDTLNADEVFELLGEGKKLGLRRNAYGQLSRSDRFTQWLGADGIESEPEYRGQGPRTVAVLDGGKGSTEYARKPLWQQVSDSLGLIPSESDFRKPIWRQVSDSLGFSNVGLAEIVVSKSGGEAQDWHFDGAGVTLQVALVDINEEQGPTEVLPRPLSSEYVSCMTDSDASISDRLTSNAIHRPAYDLCTIGLVALWSVIRPLLDVKRARFVIEHIGLPPPVVRLLAPLGVATLYNAAMVHRGGQNKDTANRPILAVHMRGAGDYGPAAIPEKAS
eukprot:CAMPEP_0113559818 /NCGR_PEP_ID=MMETSP0015_2-20120614/19101_1 /TAXON_ID=2838 /ORGANISM="Odontella" /LENGTH=382 /DNA_ID=CAMNT_0000461483 /DNA_START=386 /DNA_END=1534 /DNA_ORIENTATION=- /assembly_acc=CAM_ASM_000160